MKLSRRARIILGVVAGLPFAAFFVATRIPYPVDRLALPGDSLVLTDRHGVVLRTVPRAGGGRATWVPLDRIAPVVVQATLAGEDHRFYEHGGADGVALVRAGWLTLRHGRVMSGGSTITMQLVRTVEPHPRTLAGKIGEVVDAVRMERVLSKAQILEQYLNRVYYGNGAHGIEAAARRYFGKPAAALGVGEGTLLAVLPRAPTGYDPYLHRAQALARRRHVLDLMEKRGWIDGVGRAWAEREELTFATAPAPLGPAPHFVDWVLGGLPAAQRDRGGTVRTTLDLALQRRLERAVVTHLEERPRLRQAGVVAIEPRTGGVLAMVGSGDYRGQAGQLNITTVRRHPGSTLKPFVYALALEHGASPASLARDRRDAIPGYVHRRRTLEHGDARFREALAGSFNLAAVDVLHQVGVSTLLERLRLAGLGPLSGTAPEYGLDLALGDARVRLVDLAAAYGFLVSEGRVVRASFLADEPGAPIALFSPEVSFLVMDMLADPHARRARFGADLPLDLPFPVAAKTGTSSGYADTLTIAATREVVVAAWAGAFDGSGTRGALAMWSAAPLARAALLAARDRQGANLTLPPRPATVVSAVVCAITGHRAQGGCPTKAESFIPGTEPVEGCPGHPPLEARLAEP